MSEHHRDLVRQLEATGDLDAVRRHLADGLEAVAGSTERADRRPGA
jgi:hypothetical protein